MTQQEIDILYNLTILIFEDKWFKDKKRTRDEVQEWVRLQLAESGIYTVPCGMSWGVLVDKLIFDKYEKKN